MRSKDLGVIKGIAEQTSGDISLELFRRMCLVRYFEQGVINAGREKFLSYQVYLSSGQEAVPAAVSLAAPNFMIFAQHRCHGTYLSYGGDPVRLRDELLGLPTGTSGGRAGSNCVQCHENGVSMFGHHGLIGENVPLGVGAALGSNKPVVCFFGDGAAEEDYVFAAMGFAATHKLPVLFVCEDNNLSILTPVAVRRSWEMTGIAGSFGMPAEDIADDPWTIYAKVTGLKTGLPAFINIRTCRQYWHVGSGVDGPSEWDRFGLVKETLKSLGHGEEAEAIEKKITGQMKTLWDPEQLQRLSKR